MKNVFMQIILGSLLASYGAVAAVQFPDLTCTPYLPQPADHWKAEMLTMRNGKKQLTLRRFSLGVDGAYNLIKEFSLAIEHITASMNYWYNPRTTSYEPVYLSEGTQFLSYHGNEAEQIVSAKISYFNSSAPYQNTVILLKRRQIDDVGNPSFIEEKIGIYCRK